MPSSRESASRGGGCSSSSDPVSTQLAWVDRVAQALALNQPAACSHGEQWRDFLYSGDLADAFAALLLSSVNGPVNLASGRPVQIRDLVRALAQAAGRPELVRLGALPVAAGEPTELLADVSRLRDEVGWARQRPSSSAQRKRSAGGEISFGNQRALL